MPLPASAQGIYIIVSEGIRPHWWQDRQDCTFIWFPQWQYELWSLSARSTDTSTPKHAGFAARSQPALQVFGPRSPKSGFHRRFTGDFHCRQPIIIAESAVLWRKSQCSPSAPECGAAVAALQADGASAAWFDDGHQPAQVRRVVCCCFVNSLQYSVFYSGGPCSHMWLWTAQVSPMWLIA